MALVALASLAPLVICLQKYFNVHYRVYLGRFLIIGTRVPRVVVGGLIFSAQKVRLCTKAVRYHTVRTKASR